MSGPLPDNKLVNVVTYQKANMASMMNESPGISLSNRQFDQFQNTQANLGSAISFQIPSRGTASNGLVVNSFQQTQLRQQTLTVTQSANAALAYSDNQFIFNMKDYMKSEQYARSLAMGNKIETDILKNITSSVTDNTAFLSKDVPNPNFGNLVDKTSGPFRFAGDGRTAINSQVQLAQFVADFRDFGAANGNECAILPMTKIPQIIDNASSKFAPSRNDDIVSKWMFSDFAGFEWYQSNLLPLHIAGNVGKTNTVLTLTGVNDPSGNNVTRLTFSGATPDDLKALVYGDRGEFIDGVSGQTDLRFLNWTSYTATDQPVQFRVTDIISNTDGSGNITVEIYPALQWTPGLNQNLNAPLNAGMQVRFVNSYRAGIIMSGNPLYLAMPALPNESPYETSVYTDDEFNLSFRHYWGSQFGANLRGYIIDTIWASTFVAEYGLCVCFPV